MIKKLIKLTFKLSIIALIIFICVFFLAKKKSTNATSSQAQSSNFNIPQEVEVVTLVAKKQQIQLFKELPARISAYKIAEVRPQIDGIIKKQLFEEGSFVKEKQALYQVDPSLYKADYEAAHAKLKAAGLKKERYAELLQIDAISRQEYDDAVADLESARSEVAKANTYLDYTKIYAPISGYIGKSNLTQGALVSANQLQILTTITQLDPIFIDITLPTKDLSTIANQENISVSVIVNGEEYQNQGTLKFSEVFADPSTDSVNLRAKISNLDKKLLPGMFVTAKLHLNPIESIIIPQRSSVRTPDGDLKVFIIDEKNTAKSKTIKASQEFEGNWIVLEGLEDGEIIVYEGLQKISDGTKVKPLPLNE